LNVILEAVFPVFALILLGYICGKRGMFGPTAVDTLNRFVMYLALPALLFQAMAETELSVLANTNYLIVFGGAVFLTFFISFWLDRRAGRDLTTVSIQSLASSYPNAGYMGAPLCLIVLGTQSLPAVAISSIVTVCVLMAVSIVIIEFDRPARVPLPKLLLPVIRSLVKNPLLISPVAGLLWSAGSDGHALPGAIVQFLDLLAGAASPCALITIGLFLTQQRGTGDVRTVARIISLKLLVQPAIAAGLIVFFPMETTWAHAAILLSALPVGTGPFMLAKLYNRDAAVTSRAILLSTVASLVTVSALIAWFEHG
jgi:malonate transporter